MGCTCSTGRDVKEVGQPAAAVAAPILVLHNRHPAAAAGGAARLNQFKVAAPQAPPVAPRRPLVRTDDPCIVCDVNEGVARFHCEAGHVICISCFENQVVAWSDLVTGDCTRLDLLMARVGGTSVKPTNLTPQEFALTQFTKIDKIKARGILGDIPCCMPGCIVHITAAETRLALARVVTRGARTTKAYSLACKHQAEKVDIERKRLRSIATSPATTTATAKATRTAGGAAPSLMNRERSAREIFIEEELLTLHCPKCTLAVADFSDCFAVQCAGCRTWFCAWCLDFHGTSKEAHAHVAICDENPTPDKSVWSTLEKFTAHHQERRLSQCTLFLKQEHDVNLQRRVQPLLQEVLGRNAWYQLSKATALPETPLAPVSPLPRTNTSHRRVPTDADL